MSRSEDGALVRTPPENLSSFGVKFMSNHPHLTLVMNSHIR